MGLKLEMQQNPRKKWSTLLAPVLQNYNNTVHSTTGYTPSFLLFGTDRIGTTDNLSNARITAQLRSDKFKELKKQNFDRNKKDLKLRIGDLVNFRTQTNHPDHQKLSPRYKAPFIVHSISGTLNAHIRDFNDTKAQPFLVHINRLEPYFLRAELSAAGECGDHSSKNL